MVCNTTDRISHLKDLMDRQNALAGNPLFKLKQNEYNNHLQDEIIKKTVIT
jgi:hypothetical protein